jgi:hypothetical protein
MSDLESLRLSVAEAIRSAFPVGEPPDVELMRNDHCPECQETVALFVGKPWPAVLAADLQGNPGPGFLTAAGFRYYLPAMMLRSVEAWQELDCFPDSVVGELAPAGGKPTPDHREKLTGFTSDQINAILSFLRFAETSEKFEWADLDWPEEAIQAVPVQRRITRGIKYWIGQLNKGAPMKRNEAAG